MMRDELLGAADQRTKDAIAELEETIRRRFPHAVFSLMAGEDSESLWLVATVDIDDPDEVLDLVIERIVDLQVDEGIRIHVLPERTAARMEETLRANQGRSTATLKSAD
jgi:hypothetical protein